MKRLVVCCDGTWNQADRPAVSNVEKIALAVKTNQPVPPPDPTTGQSNATIQQEVLYITGVGTHGYFADRVLGGAAGTGLTANVFEAYRWLCVNYDPGDEIFLFGFSRGAYTARSVGGMIAAVSLLDLNRLSPRGFGATLQAAEAVYRLRTDTDAHREGRNEKAQAFRRAHALEAVTIRFVGVFDTVGALGIPGPSRERMKFHDVTLGPTVQHARQALAIDERRMTFEPSVWTIDTTQPAEKLPLSVKQVWFEGVHSDVGGGYPDDQSGLSEFSLAWMAGEATAHGLVFDPNTLAAQFHRGAKVKLHNSLNGIYPVINLARNAGDRLKSLVPGQQASAKFRDSRRVLAQPRNPKAEANLFLASSAHAAYQNTDYQAQAPNIGWWYQLYEADQRQVEVAEVSNRPSQPPAAS